MDKIQQQIERLVKEHGTLTAVSKATGIQLSYLSLLRRGKRGREIRDPLLKKLGLERRIIYRRIK